MSAPLHNRPGLQPKRAPAHAVSGGVAAIAFYLAVLLAPQVLGGVFGWSMAAIAALVALAAALGLLAYPHRVAVMPSSVAWAFALALGWTALQVLPLPCGWVAWLNPAAFDSGRQVSRLMIGADQAIHVCRWSLSPAATYLELIKLVTLLSVFWLGCKYTAVLGRKYVLRAVLVAALLLAVVALAHRMAGLDRVFGMYKPLYARPTILAPLLNPNHLAGVMALAAPISLGFGLSSSAYGRSRWLWFVAYLVLATVNVLTLSRGGIAAFVMGSVLFAVLWWWRGLPGQRGRLGLGAVSALMASVAAIAAYLVADELIGEWHADRSHKLALFAQASEVAQTHPVFGVGRGAFAQATAARLQQQRFDHPENILLQWAGEWGIPMALMIMALLIVVLTQALREARSSVRIGALCGLLALVAQNLVDFSLELLGVSVLAVLVLAAVTAVAAPRRTSAPSASRWPFRLATAGVAAQLVVAVVALSHARAWDRHELQAQLFRHMEEGSLQDAPELLHAALSGYPAEPAFATLAAYAFWSEPSGKGLRWLNYAMRLAPGWAQPHWLAARWLLEHGHNDQAMLELRAAAERSPQASARMACRLRRALPSQALLLHAVPRPSQAAADFLQIVAACTDDTEAERELDALLLAHIPRHPHALVRQAKRLSDEKRYTEAVEALKNALRGAPTEPQVHAELARVWLAQGDTASAARVIADARAAGLRSRELYRAGAEVQAAVGDFAAMRRELAALRGLVHDSPSELARAWHFAGQLEQSLGHAQEAARAFTRAYRHEPRPLYRRALERLGAPAVLPPP